eukprot:4452775-Pleurochrysis_carterae.AAC.3
MLRDRHWPPGWRGCVEKRLRECAPCIVLAASAGVVSRHEASLTSARASFESALQRLLAQPLPPPRASRLRVRILEMGVSVPPPGATHFGVLLAFGPIAVAVAGSTEVAVANAAVTEARAGAQR